jgi:peptide/nickel transport system substrate-binding protein
VPHHLRWQLALALAGAMAIGAVLVVVSSRNIQVRPAAGGQLVEALVGPPTTLNPLFATTEAERELTGLVYAGLTRLDGSGLVQPDLATWQLGPDGRTYTFTLRAGLVWHDGQPVTADDVVLTAKLAADDNARAPHNPLTTPWRSAEVTRLDERSVRVTLPEPYAPFLAAATLGLVPAHLLAEVPPAELPAHPFSVHAPVGAGGYRLAPGALTAGGARLERHDGYWAATGRPRPYLDQLQFQFFPTRAAAREAFSQRRVQAMGGVPADSVGALGAETRFYSAVDAGYTLVYLNPQNVLFTDPTVSLALSLGLDRGGLIQDPELLNGQAVPAVSPIPPGSWAYDPAVRPPAFDPAQARKMLEQAGWIDSDNDGVRDRDGKPLAFELAVSNDPLAIGLAERAQRDWKALGADVAVRPLDQQSMVNALRNRTHQAVLFGVNLGGEDPDPFPLWHSSQIEGGQNFAGFNDPEADRLLTEARQPQAAYPAEVARRRQLYAAFQARFAERPPAIMLFHPVYTYAVADREVGGIQLPQLLSGATSRFVTLPDWYARTERVLAVAGGRPERQQPPH